MSHPLMQRFRRHWFFIGLAAVFLVTLADSTGTVAAAGRWVRAHHGPEICIMLIFFFAGLVLDAAQVKAGVRDVGGTLMALALIFVIAPLLALPVVWLPVERGVAIGLVLVALMPTTLSSGVVMTGAAGGNLAHALQITILANALAILTIPLLLTVLLNHLGVASDVAIDRAMLMLKLAGFVLLPLSAGGLANWWSGGVPVRCRGWLQVLSQCLIFAIVWMGVSQSRRLIAGSGWLFLKVALLVAAFHGLLLATAWVGIALARFGPGRRESVLFMGVQKTLPLSIMLQVSLFPQYGAALVVCVVHHMVHLMIDGYIVGTLRSRHPGVRP